MPCGYKKQEIEGFFMSQSGVLVVNPVSNFSSLKRVHIVHPRVAFLFSDYIADSLLNRLSK